MMSLVWCGLMPPNTGDSRPPASYDARGQSSHVNQGHELSGLLPVLKSHGYFPAITTAVTLTGAENRRRYFVFLRL